ncbi:hypothetical protein [Haloactinomyces albus]|uniref:Uncharacterized protein n=1 Tax=Haloactinomyces albus TaxID=1352928 RepID=A0AAE3ZIS1_9ACTN|nr:hypothetical protein [Haloactinomyces albus]MDR7304339.1 hypothetical protein [Haloactinomyces albus]
MATGLRSRVPESGGTRGIGSTAVDRYSTVYCTSMFPAESDHNITAA